jgi:excisionase family DNA binding protein
MMTSDTPATAPPTSAPSPWLTVKESAARAKVSDETIYDNIKRGRLRAARIGTRKDIRILQDWLDAWMVSLSTPTIVNPDAPGGTAPEGAIPFKRRGPQRR